MDGGIGGTVMLHIGADLHKDQVTLVTQSDHGDVLLKKRIPCKCVNHIRAFFEASERPFQLAVEAVGFYHWFYDLVEPYADRIYLANATEVRHRSVSGPKTDFKDATNIAELLRIGLFERDYHLRSYVASPPLRALRHQTRRRNRLVRRQTDEKNALRKYLLQCNLKGPRTIDAPSLARWLSAQEHKLPEHTAATAWDIADQLAVFERQQARIERTIAKRVRDLQPWKRLFEILDSLPGVGDIVAWTLIAEIEDFTRFDRAEQLVNYVGLDPRVFQSDKTVRHGKVAKQGPRDARWALQQAAWVAVVHDRRCQLIYDRIRARSGKKKAAVAVARKLLVWAYHLVKRNQLYHPNQAWTATG